LSDAPSDGTDQALDKSNPPASQGHSHVTTHPTRPPIGGSGLNEAYLAHLKELGSSPRLVTLAVVTDTRWVNHAADSILAAIIANKPSTLAGLDSILTELCWTPWPMPDE